MNDAAKCDSTAEGDPNRYSGVLDRLSWRISTPQSRRVGEYDRLLSIANNSNADNLIKNYNYELLKHQNKLCNRLTLASANSIIRTRIL